MTRRSALDVLLAPPRWLLAAPFLTCLAGTVGVKLIDWLDRHDAVCVDLGGDT